MIRQDNYVLQMRSAQQLFLTYDQQTLIDKFSLEHDGAYLYPVMLGRRYRLCRQTGDLQVESGGQWQDANTFNQVLTLLDLLCDSQPHRYLTGRWVRMDNFGRAFHRNLLEEEADPLAEAFDRNPEALHRACRELGGTPVSGGDLSYAIELFDGLAICLQFWHADEDFPACLRWFWDENAPMYIRYETMYYALGMLREALRRFL